MLSLPAALVIWHKPLIPHGIASKIGAISALE
jgi:hypothetical protein